MLLFRNIPYIVVNGDKMDNIKRNEIKQVIKSKISSVLQEELILIFNDYEISDEKKDRLVKDILIWANITIDAELD